jgi:putative transposase
MYDFRKWTPDQRKAAINERLLAGFPSHSPPHVDVPDRWRLITAACYEHKHILSSSERIQWFENELLVHFRNQSLECAGWVVLSNHYHALVKIPNIDKFGKSLGQLHGRTSFEMNRMDEQAKRKCWFRFSDRCMRNERHFLVTLNYIHNNPVKHGYVKKWSDWPYSSFHWYLENKGREWLVDVFREYPVLDYGAKWDIF